MNVLRPTLLLALLGVASCARTLPRTAASAGPERPPNIVYILADDAGYGDFGVYGQKQIRTPRIDEMAREGMRFTQHYAGAPVCAPSRSVLMTGLHTGHTTIRGNFGIGPGGKEVRIPLRDQDVTVAEVLKKAGYATGIVGKWGLGEAGTEGAPNEQGFDYFFGFLDQHAAHEYYPEFLWRNDEKVPLPGNENGRHGQYADDLFMNEALSFIGQHRDGPFFLYMALTLPHALMEAPNDSILASYAGKYPPKEAAFAAMITRLDHDVGRVLDRLHELGIDDNTIVIFASDNGPHHEDGHDAAFFDSNGPLRGTKRDMYEGGIRVPFIAWAPGRIRAGAVSDLPSYFADFLPTAAELAGVRFTGPTDGTSFAPTLFGREQPRHDFLYWEFPEGNSQGVRMGDWKGVRIPAFTGAMQLYDLKTDVSEAHDVAAAHPDVVRKITAIMEREHQPAPLFWARDRESHAGR
jgi:arylsulfatase A-like enzyme